MPRKQQKNSPKKTKVNNPRAALSAPSAPPMMANILPASGDCPDSIRSHSIKPMMAAAIPLIRGATVQLAMPQTRAPIASTDGDWFPTCGPPPGGGGPYDEFGPGA